MTPQASTNLPLQKRRQEELAKGRNGLRWQLHREPYRVNQESIGILRFLEEQTLKNRSMINIRSNRPTIIIKPHIAEQTMGQSLHCTPGKTSSPHVRDGTYDLADPSTKSWILKTITKVCDTNAFLQPG